MRMQVRCACIKYCNEDTFLRIDADYRFILDGSNVSLKAYDEGSDFKSLQKCAY